MLSEPIDRDGHVKCSVCGKTQSSRFAACIYCCHHEELDLVEEWQGPDDGGGWAIDFKCAICGKNFGFRPSDVADQYKAVLRKNGQ